MPFTSISRTSNKRFNRNLFFIGLMVFASSWYACKKTVSQVYQINGNITSSMTGAGLAASNVVLAQQVIANGIYNASYTPAAETTTDANGYYAMSWDRTNSNGVKITASYPNYITRTKYINPQDLSISAPYQQDLTLYPEAYLSVRLVHTGIENDFFGLKYANANFDCACCDSDEHDFYGSLDTTITCKIYGNFMLKYDKSISLASIDTLVHDSIYVSAFDTTYLELDY